MKGFRDEKNKFHPITNSKGVRKARDQSEKTQGVRFKKITGKPKKSGTFMIGGSGLRPIFTNVVPLEVGGAYWLGASDSPKHVILTKVTDDLITYRAYPYGEDIRIERVAGEDLIRTGLENRLKLIENSSVSHLFEKDIKNFRLLLESDDDGVNKVDFRDLQPVSVEVDLVRQPKDRKEDSKFWHHAEEFGGVGGIGFVDEKTGKRVEGDNRTKAYSISTSRGQLKKIKNDPLYKNFKVTEDKYKGK